MAFRRQAKRYRRKRAFRKGKSKSSKKDAMQMRGPQIVKNVRSKAVPDRYRTQLSFEYYKNIESIAGTSGFLNVSLNNVYDPLPTIGNLGCNGYDELRAQYNGWLCYGSKIQVDFVNNVTNSTAIVYVRPSTVEATSVTGTLNIAGANNVKSSKMLSTLGSGAERGQIKHYMSVAKLVGRPTKEIEVGARFRMSTAGQPSTAGFAAAFWQIMGLNLSNHDSVGVSISLKVRVTYYVEFFQRLTLLPATQTQDTIYFKLPNSETEIGYLGATGATGAGPIQTFEFLDQDGDEVNIPV